MKLYLSLLIFTFSLHATYAQVVEKASLYNSDGELLIDTSLTITMSQLTKWKKLELNLLDELCSEIKYPPVAVANQIQGIVILSIECDSSSSFRKIEAVRSVRGGISEECIAVVKKYEAKICKYLKNSTGLTETFYIPFNFELVDYSKLVRQKKALPVIHLTEPEVISPPLLRQE